MQSQFYTRLVKGYIEKTLTKEELAIFINLLSKGELDGYLDKDMEATISQHLFSKKPKRALSIIKYAAVFLLLGFGTFYIGAGYFKKSKEDSSAVLPGYEHAILRMADGTELVLDTNQHKKIVTESGVVLSNKEGEGLVYDLSKIKQSNTNLTNQYSSIETPKGGTYQLILSDGTKVWLNASSKLKFPLLFSGGERLVEMEGEVYFEVASNKSKPFIVKSRGQDIRVLGTVFNVNDYLNEEAVKTTLLEGSISINTPTLNRIVKAGQQAQVNGGNIVIKDVDVSQSVAWKEGYFKFDKLNVSDIMRQVERWYNVEVIYNDSFKDDRFVGKIKRSASITELIGIFNEGGLKVSLQDRKLYVSNSK